MIKMSMSYHAISDRDEPYVCRDPLARIRHSFTTLGESKTRQSEKQSADINHIVERFQRTGQLPPPRQQPMYADVTALQGDLTEKVNESRATQEQYVAEVHESRKKAAAKAAESTPPTPPAPAATPTSSEVK